MIRNRCFITAGLSIFLLASAVIFSCNRGSEKSNQEAGTKPNIIIITADDLGWAVTQQFDQQLLPPDTRENLPFDEETIAEVLKNAGYLTAHVGKWHIGDAANYPEVHGFDINRGSTLWGCPSIFFYPYRGRIYNSERYISNLEEDSDGNYFHSREGEYLTDRLTDEALKIMEDVNGRPLFLNMSYLYRACPHRGQAGTGGEI